MTGKSTIRPLLAIIIVIVLVAAAAASLAGCGYDTASETASYDLAVEEGVYSDEDRASTSVQSEETLAVPSSGIVDDTASIPESERLVIRTKSLRLEVDDVEVAVQTVRNIAKTYDAIVTNVNVSSDDSPVYRYDEYGSTAGSGEALSGWITVRVPSTDFEPFVDSVMDLGDVKWEGESADDVTQQYVDLNARLGNLQTEESRLREFFDAAEDVEEMLLVEKELSRVRGEIEAMQAQITYLERQAAYSTVTVELSEPQEIVRPDGQDWGFEDAVTTGVQLAAGIVRALIVISIGSFGIVPLILIIAIVIFLRLWIRHRKGRKTPKPPVAE